MVTNMHLKAQPRLTKQPDTGSNVVANNIAPFFLHCTDFVHSKRHFMSQHIEPLVIQSQKRTTRRPLIIILSRDAERNIVHCSLLLFEPMETHKSDLLDVIHGSSNHDSEGNHFFCLTYMQKTAITHHFMHFRQHRQPPATDPNAAGDINTCNRIKPYLQSHHVLKTPPH